MPDNFAFVGCTCLLSCSLTRSVDITRFSMVYRGRVYVMNFASRSCELPDSKIYDMHSIRQLVSGVVRRFYPVDRAISITESLNGCKPQSAGRPSQK